MAMKMYVQMSTLLLYLVASVNSDNCKIDFLRTGQEVKESKYLIDLSIINTAHGMASTYFPDTKYDIIIRPKSTTLSFKEFHFKMENVNRSMSYGALELREPQLSTFDTSDYCINRVINLATPNKPNITIGWQSPPTMSGCIELLAYIKETELRYHTANLTVCEDPRIELDDPGDILKNCCACERAKYEMTFQGMWSKYTHPRNFPKKDWLVGFPTVIGAAHHSNYKIWQVYTNASDALKRFAETGYSVALELELKANQANITTFIKFRGTNFKNKTLARAQLRVDRSNHVVSLVARINPSPDWFIGVSSLELCNIDCTWMENKTLNLYAYDAGSRSGISFEQENNGYTHEVINRMNMSWPLPDDNSDELPPFYDKTNNTHEVRPMAQIHLRRIRVFGNTCARVQNETKIDESCVGEWYVANECTVTCGVGLKIMRRHYLDGYNKSNCNAKVEERLPCGDTTTRCQEDITKETCHMIEWSEWSRCSKRCGQESSSRTRNYKSNYEHKCREKFPENTLNEYKDCGHPPCPGQIMECDNTLYTKWSSWGSCSVTIDKGLQFRQRERIQKIISKEHFGLDSGYYSCMYDKRVCEGIDPASFTEEPVTEIQRGPYIPDIYASDHRHQKPRECLLKADEGYDCPGKHSGSSHYRWTYNNDLNSCELLRYKGCGGNENMFEDEMRCNEKCYIGEKIDCQLSSWSSWTDCEYHSICLNEQTRKRTVEVYPSPTGKPCPVAGRLQSRPCDCKSSKKRS